MIESLPERVAFEFADRMLVGDVVDTTARAAYNQPFEPVFTVEHNGSRYTVPASAAMPA